MLKYQDYYDAMTATALGDFLLKLISILALTLLTIAMAVPASAQQSDPSWKPNGELLKQFEHSAPLGGFIVQHPKGYQMQKVQISATINGGRWTSLKRDDGTYGLFTAVWITLTKADLDAYSLTDYLTQGLGAIKPHMSEWSQTGVQKGTINGQSFCRSYWTGKDANQAQMRGFLYVTKMGNKVIELGSQDFVPAEEKYLALAEASILTFKLQ